MLHFYRGKCTEIEQSVTACYDNGFCSPGKWRWHAMNPTHQRRRGGIREIWKLWEYLLLNTPQQSGAPVLTALLFYRGKCTELSWVYNACYDNCWCSLGERRWHAVMDPTHQRRRGMGKFRKFRDLVAETRNSPCRRTSSPYWPSRSWRPRWRARTLETPSWSRHQSELPWVDRKADHIVQWPGRQSIFVVVLCRNNLLFSCSCN